MELLKTNDGVSYQASYVSESLPVLIYRHGYKSDPMQSAFYKVLYPYIKNKFNIFMPYTPGSGWEYPVTGSRTPIGKYFAEWVMKNYKSDGRLFITGHSAGGDWDDVANTEGVTAFAPVAGSANSDTNIKRMADRKIPVNAWHGRDDRATPNTYDAGYKTAITRFKNAFRGDLVWNEFANIDHGEIPGIAYKPENGLAEWFLSKGTPTVPEKSGEDIPVKNIYFSESLKKIVFELENGERKELTPD